MVVSVRLSPSLFCENTSSSWSWQWVAVSLISYRSSGKCDDMESYLLDSAAAVRGWRLSAGQRDKKTIKTMMKRARTAPTLEPMETGICQLVVEACTHSLVGLLVSLRYMDTHTCRRTEDVKVFYKVEYMDT